MKIDNTIEIEDIPAIKVNYYFGVYKRESDNKEYKFIKEVIVEYENKPIEADKGITVLNFDNETTKLEVKKEIEQKIKKQYEESKM